MRTFILRARKSSTSPSFDLNDLPNAGNMQIAAACVINALWVSNNVRQDTEIHVVLEGPPTPPRTVTFVGKDIQGLPFDERGVAWLVQKALKKAFGIAKADVKQVSPGITVSSSSFESLVKYHAEKGPVYYLHGKGKDIRETDFAENVTFVFGDYIGMPAKSESFLENAGAERLSIGPETLFASQCVTIVHNEMDRR